MNLARYFKQKVESVMTARDKAPLLSLAAALYPISLAYGAGQWLRAFVYRHRMMPVRQLPCKVICVGNITAGGTGKTPMTIYVAQKVQQLGHRVAIVSRGYRGSAESRGGIVSDGKEVYMDPEQAGDEPYLMASLLKTVPVIVGKNRYGAGMRALQQFQPDVIVLDDGFQHLRLQRDIDLVLLDRTSPFGNGHLLPRGILREPISALARSSACILTRCRDGNDDPATSPTASIKHYSPHCPVFSSLHDPYVYSVQAGAQLSVVRTAEPASPREINQLTKDSVFGFSGIARNADFQNTVQRLGFDADGFLEFPDHHRYTPQDLENIQSQAAKAGARRLITTEKDLVRLAPPNPFALELIVVGVKISFGNHREQFISFLKQQLARQHHS